MRKPTITETEAREHLNLFYMNMEKIKGVNSFNQKEKIKIFRLQKEPLTDAQIMGVEDLIKQLENLTT